MKALREEYYRNIADGMTEHEATVSLTFKIYKGGLMVIQAGALIFKGVRAAGLIYAAGGASGISIAGGAIMGPIAWSFVGIVYIAETSINYRRYKRGDISKTEFIARAKTGAVGTIGGLAGATAGAALGFLAGSAVFPVVGSIVGVLVGGVVGGLAGRKMSVKLFVGIENKIAKARKLKKALKE